MGRLYLIWHAAVKKSGFLTMPLCIPGHIIVAWSQGRQGRGGGLVQDDPRRRRLGAKFEE